MVLLASEWYVTCCKFLNTFGVPLQAPPGAGGCRLPACGLRRHQRGTGALIMQKHNLRQPETISIPLRNNRTRAAPTNRRR